MMADQPVKDFDLKDGWKTLLLSHLNVSLLKQKSEPIIKFELQKNFC